MPSICRSGDPEAKGAAFNLPIGHDSLHASHSQTGSASIIGLMEEIGREALVELVRGLEPGSIVGISGYGGSGKSTLARELSNSIPRSVVIGVDHYYIKDQDVRDEDWNAFDRSEMRKEIEQQRMLGDTRLVICEGVGIFHPDTVDCFDIRIWVDTDLGTATIRGMKRDREEQGNDHDRLWREIWEPNERSFEAKHSPKEKAHFSVKN